MKRALFLVLCATMCGVVSTSRSFAGVRHRASAPSYDVRIVPTAMPEGTTSVDIDSDHWRAQGFDLRGLMAQIYAIDPARIELPAPAASEGGPARFDVEVALAGNETDEAIQQLLERALEKRFHLSAAMETRSVEVYVLTAPDGPGPGLHAHPNDRSRLRRDVSRDEAEDIGMAGTLTIAERVCPGISSAGIKAQAVTLSSLGRALETDLARPILDETRLNAAYDFEVPEYRSREELFALLHERLGLTVTPGQRSLEILVVRPAQVGLMARLGTPGVL